VIEEGFTPGDLELHTILNEISQISTHLSLTDGSAEAIALWVMLAHTLESSEFAPRLAFVSPVHECGKTTAMELLLELVPHPMPTSNVSPAVIYRSIKADITLLIDEADTFMEGRDELTGIMNSGHKRATAYVYRCIGNDHTPTKSLTFCAMAIARIGNLSPTLASRSIEIRMRRKRPDEKLTRFSSAHRESLKQLKARIEKWKSTGRYKSLNGADPTLPLSNRAADNSRHMVSIACLAGGEWPIMAVAAAMMLAPKVELVAGERLLGAIKQVFASTTETRLPSATLCSLLNFSSDEDDWTQAGLAAELRRFDIRPKAMRIGANVVRGYDRADFEDAWARYVNGSGVSDQAADRNPQRT
jgi:putative DNA primase/helicase